MFWGLRFKAVVIQLFNFRVLEGLKTPDAATTRSWKSPRTLALNPEPKP